MPQATRRWISEKVKSLNESNVLPFHEGAIHFFRLTRRSLL